VDVVGHWLNVRQGSYQVRGSQQNFRWEVDRKEGGLLRT